MAVLRLTLVLLVLAALQADAVSLRADPFTDTISVLINDVGPRIGNALRGAGPQKSQAPYLGRPVLEPGTMFLMGFGLLGICVWARRRWARRPAPRGAATGRSR
jgi:hypothetical protein